MDEGGQNTTESVALDARGAPPVGAATPHPSTRMSSWENYLRELVAAAFWIYAFLKVFVADLDRWFIENHFPSATWILDYKFGFLLAAAALVAVFWRRHLSWTWIAFIICYPLILCVWRIPVWVIKRRSWTLSLAFVALVVGAVRSFRVNFLLLSAFTLGTILCVFSRSTGFLVLGAALVGTALPATYVRSVAVAFQPTLDAFSSKTLDAIWAFLQRVLDNAAVVGIPVDAMTAEQRSSWTTNLQLTIIFNRLCYFVADKVRELRRSNLNAIMYIIRLLVLFLETAWAFYLLNYSLFKLDPSNYVTPKAPNGFDFFYYSFHTLFSNSAGGVEPVSVASRVLAMGATVFMALIFAVVVVFVLTSVQKSRDDGRMDATVEAIRLHAQKMELYLGERYGMTVPEAVSRLRELGAGLIGVIYYLSPSLGSPADDPASKSV